MSGTHNDLSLTHWFNREPVGSPIAVTIPELLDRRTGYYTEKNEERIVLLAFHEDSVRVVAWIRCKCPPEQIAWWKQEAWRRHVSIERKGEG